MNENKYPLGDAEVVRRLLDHTRKRHTIGDLITIRTSSIEISPEHLHELFRQAGLEYWRATPVRKDIALRAALQQYVTATAKERRRIIRKVANSELTTDFALVHERRTNRKPEYSTDILITLDKSTCQLSFDPEELPGVQKEFARRSALYTQREVNHMLKGALLAYGGVELADTKGMVFMPAAAREVTEAVMAVSKALDATFGTCDTTVLGILDDIESRRLLSQLLFRRIEEDYDHAMNLLLSIKRNPKGRMEHFRFASLRVRAVRGKANLYRNIVEIDISRMESLCKEVGEQLHREVTVWNRRQPSRREFVLASEPAPPTA